MRIGLCRDVFLLNKPNLYIADYFVKTPLTFHGTTRSLASARCSPYPPSPDRLD
jgi:hypothetical protein